MTEIPLVLSLRAARRLAATTTREFIEVHRDGRKHHVTRGRRFMDYLRRSKYLPADCNRRGCR